MVKTALRFAALSVVAFVFGNTVYVLVCFVVFGQLVSGADAIAVFYWSALVFFPCAALVYFPAFCLLRNAQGGACNRLALFVVMPIGISYLQTVFLFYIFDGSIVTLFSPEALLFYCLFLIAGMVSTVGFAYGKYRR